MTHRADSIPDVFMPEPATILRAEMVTERDKYFEIRLDSGNDLGHLPGQFVQVSIPGIGEAPISISSSPDTHGSFEFVVRKIGRVSAALHDMNTHDQLGIRGPFGTTFPVTEALQGKDVLFICGGIGLAPLRSGIQYVLNRRADYGEVTILYGAKDRADRLFVTETTTWAARDDVRYLETVDHADASWSGNVGVITTLLKHVTVVPTNLRAVICGPPIMYKFVIMELAARGIPAEDIYVSLERRMKCGIGKCGHCQLNEYYACTDGPVFNYAALVDIPEAI